LGVTECGKVLPLQNCCGWKFEENNRVSADRWTKTTAEALEAALTKGCVQDELDFVWQSGKDNVCPWLRSAALPTFEVVNVTIEAQKDVEGDKELYAEWTAQGWVPRARKPSEATAEVLTIQYRFLKDDMRKIVTLLSDRWMYYEGVCARPRDRVATPRPALGAAAMKSMEERPEMEEWLRVEGDVVEATDKTKDLLDQWSKKREHLSAEAKEEASVSDFELGGGLRVTWMMAQKEDPLLKPLFKECLAPKGKVGHRVADDGLLERAVVQKGIDKATWVPIVPEGSATASMSWKRWAFLQLHVGLMGMHRGGEKTILLLLRVCWWLTLRADVEHWCNQCMTCLRFRKRPQKQQAIATKPLSAGCWEEVMIDLEGPSQPPDVAGNVYTMTYLCCLCQGILLEPLRCLTASEVRRAFGRCVFRSGTLPLVLRSDRGQEFRSSAMREYSALIKIRQKFGMPWRPCEQGPVEKIHQTTQTSMGILVEDVMKTHPREWTELLPVLEFAVYNTPGPHGHTPRDVDRRWSIGSPLERELQPFEVMEFEPIDDYIKGLFAVYRELKQKLIASKAESSERRADLANRFRRSRSLQIGDKVVYRDPRIRAAGGRTAWKRPLTEPCEILEVSGNRVTLRREDGTQVLAHVEDVVVVPAAARNWEKKCPI
jgi:hypothetical protein